MMMIQKRMLGFVAGALATVHGMKSAKSKRFESPEDLLKLEVDRNYNRYGTAYTGKKDKCTIKGARVKGVTGQIAVIDQVKGIVPEYVDDGARQHVVVNLKKWNLGKIHMSVPNECIITRGGDGKPRWKASNGTSVLAEEWLDLRENAEFVQPPTQAHSVNLRKHRIKKDGYAILFPRATGVPVLICHTKQSSLKDKKTTLRYEAAKEAITCVKNMGKSPDSVPVEPHDSYLLYKGESAIEIPAVGSIRLLQPISSDNTFSRPRTLGDIFSDGSRPPSLPIYRVCNAIRGYYLFAFEKLCSEQHQHADPAVFEKWEAAGFPEHNSRPNLEGL